METRIDGAHGTVGKVKRSLHDTEPADVTKPSSGMPCLSAAMATQQLFRGTTVSKYASIPILLTPSAIAASKLSSLNCYSLMQHANTLPVMLKPLLTEPT